MEMWKYRAVKHRRIGKYLFQFNLPVNNDIAEFEGVMFDNGRIIDRSVFWDSYDSHDDAMERMYESWQPTVETTSFYDREEFLSQTGHRLQSVLAF